MNGYVDKDDINKRVKIVDNNDKMYVGKLRGVEYGLLGYEIFEVEFKIKTRYFNESRIKSIKILNR